MKIKQITIRRDKTKNFTYIKIWTTLPDAYTFLNQLGETDHSFLRKVWINDKKDSQPYKDFHTFISKFNPSWCRGSITLLMKSAPGNNKKLGWRRIKSKIYGVSTELNTPLKNEGLSIQYLPKHMEEFMVRLDLPKWTGELLIHQEVDYLALWYLRRYESKSL